MKKNILICSLVLFFGHELQGQVKQRKELLLQIAALHLYLDYARKGYEVASKGLIFIGDLKEGEVVLHGDYFRSLSRVNPKLANYYKTAEILSMQFEIMKINKSIYRDLSKGDLFHGSELEHIKRTFEKLLASCGETLDELLAITTDSKLELRDDQRIKRIDELHKTMLEHYWFCLSFSQDATLLSLLKSGEKTHTRELAAIYGL